jgi:hypothetical protein
VKIILRFAIIAAATAFLASCGTPRHQLLEAAPFQNVNADLYWSEGYPRAMFGPWATATSACRLRAPARVSIVRAPAHGIAHVETRNSKWVFGGDNEFAKCNELPVRAPFMVYRPAPGFTGQDELTFRVNFVNGEQRIVKAQLRVH